MSHEPLINLKTTVQASTKIVTSKLDDEVVMMSADKGTYYGLDDIGSRVWELLASPRTVSSVCYILVGEYDVTRDECEKDVLAWLNELADQNLVRIIEPDQG